MSQAASVSTMSYFSKLKSAPKPIKVIRILRKLIDSGCLQDCKPSKNDVSMLLSVMKKHLSSISLQVIAFQVLTELTTNKNTTRSIITAGGVEPVVEAMQRHRNHVTIQELGCSMLAQIALVDNKLVEKAGGIKVVLAGMERFQDHASIQISACRTISTCFRIEAQTNSNDGLSVVEPVLKAMEENPNHTEVQALCCEALSNLSFPRAGALGIEKRGGIDLVIEAMQQNPNHASIQRDTCRVLLHLIVHNWHFSKSIIDAGGITCITKALQLYPDHEKIQQYGFQALSGLAHDEKGQDPFEISCEMIHMELKLSSIMKTMKKHHGNVNVQCSCIRLIRHLMLSNRKSVHKIANDGGITLTLSALREHSRCKLLQSLGLGALLEFCRFGSLKDRVVSDGGIDCVLNSMRRFESYDAIQYRGCFLLNQFSSDAIRCALIVAAGGMECVSIAIENYADDADVQEEGNKFLNLAHDTGVSTLSVAAAAA